MKTKIFLSLLFAPFMIAGSLNAEVPEKLIKQALADFARAVDTQGKEVTKEMLEATKKELTKPSSPLHFSKTALAEYEAGKMSISALVLQESVKETEALLEEKTVELPFFAKYYLKAHREVEWNSDQKILCYLVLNAVQRKFLTEE